MRRRRRRRRWAHPPAIHAASHFDMKKELHGFLVSISMHARGSPFCIGRPLLCRHYFEHNGEPAEDDGIMVTEIKFCSTFFVLVGKVALLTVKSYFFFCQGDKPGNHFAILLRKKEGGRNMLST